MTVLISTLKSLGLLELLRWWTNNTLSEKSLGIPDYNFYKLYIRLALYINHLGLSSNNFLKQDCKKDLICHSKYNRIFSITISMESHNSFVLFLLQVPTTNSRVTHWREVAVLSYIHKRCSGQSFSRTVTLIILYIVQNLCNQK